MIAASHLLANRFGLPMVLSELGASGGLNLLFDRYQLIVDETRFGARTPIITLAPDWSGPLPPDTRFEVSNKAGVDLSPLDPTKAKDRLRLMAYSWPDQPDRIEHKKTPRRIKQPKWIKKTSQTGCPGGSSITPKATFIWSIIQ